MSFSSPGMFVLLLAIPVVVAWYVSAQRRRAARAQVLAGEGLVATSASAAPKRRARRHVPFALFLVALTLLVVALARPSTTVKTPQQRGTVMIALDVSNSMRATDVKPSRIEVAKAAAKAFVGQQARPIRIGVVAFGDGAVVVQAPTTDHTAVDSAIDHVSVGGGTAIGQALLTSLDAIAGKPITVDPATIHNDDAAINVGYYGGTVIVAFTDGENTNGIDPALVANVASAAGVRVHTIGVGTEAGTTFQYQGFTIATALDSAELKQLASETDGTYHPSTDPGGVSAITRTIRLHFTLVSQHTEVTALFCALAVAVLVLASLASLRWLGRLV